MKWLLICNTKLFDIQKTFKETDTITWPQIDGISVGDTVYFYLSAPHNAIHYKCEVQKKDTHRMNEITSKYVIHPMFYDNKQTYIELKLLQSFPDGLASEKELREHGVSNLQISSVMSKETVDYIDSKSNKGFFKNKKLVGIIALGLSVLIAAFSLMGENKILTEEPESEEASTEELEQQETDTPKQQVEEDGILLPQTTNLDSQIANVSKERFEIISGDLSWQEAKKACEAQGGHLATITSEEEYEEICELADESGLTYLWLGANLYSENDLWENVGWITGEDWLFSKWYPGEPSKEDVDGAKEYYLCLWKAKHQGEEIGWTFNDQRNDIVEAVSSISGNIGYICEYE